MLIMILFLVLILVIPSRIDSGVEKQECNGDVVNPNLDSHFSKKAISPKKVFFLHPLRNHFYTNYKYHFKGL